MRWATLDSCLLITAILAVGWMAQCDATAVCVQGCVMIKGKRSRAEVD